MQLIAFIHGIGDFYPETEDKIKLLMDMQREADELYGPMESKVVFLSYEKLLDGRLSSKAIQFAASTASAYYTGTPVIGRLLADYGADIFQYYMSSNVRREVCKSVVAQLAMAVTLNPPNRGITGITLVGHSLGSLVTLRILHMVQAMTSKNGSLKLHDKLIDELLADHVLERNILMVGDIPMNVVLMGSPAFSRLRGVKLATRKMALAESPVADIFANQVTLKRPAIVSTYSEQLYKDPLSGPLDNSFPGVSIQVGTSHPNVLSPLHAYLMYLTPGVRAVQNGGLENAG